MPSIPTDGRSGQVVPLTATTRLRILRAPAAVVLVAERRSAAAIDDDAWAAVDRPVPLPLEHVGELCAAIETAARRAP